MRSLKEGYRRPAAIPFPDDNPFSHAKAALGRTLFFDTSLSASGTVACGSCHQPDKAWGDGRARSIGHAGVVLPRHTPGLANLAWAAALTWDGRMESLEQQAVDPIANPAIGATSLADLARRLQADPGYGEAFRAAFGDARVTPDRIGAAIATFERTIVSPLAPFDHWVDGDEAAIPEAAKRGFVLFTGKARCAACHSGWRMTDDSFHDIGLPATGDLGRGARVPGEPTLRHAFKTPTLRGVGESQPYMHDGSVATLDAVLAHYADGAIGRASLDPDVRRLDLTAAERRDLLAFLETLTAAGAAP